MKQSEEKEMGKIFDPKDRQTLLKIDPIFEAYSDITIRKLYFEKNFTLKLSNKKEWRTMTVHR